MTLMRVCTWITKERRSRAVRSRSTKSIVAKVGQWYVRLHLRHRQHPINFVDVIKIRRAQLETLAGHASAQTYPQT
jgi:hypothetical protein